MCGCSDVCVDVARGSNRSVGRRRSGCKVDSRHDGR
jgi:hypothetical protein